MDAKSLSRIGVLSASAVAAYVFESLLPSPFPWARVGLSNVFVVVTLFGFGLKDAFLVNLAKQIGLVRRGVLHVTRGGHIVAGLGAKAAVNAGGER